MTALTIPAYKWDAANHVPHPEAVLVLHCTEGHDVPLTHRIWHLLDDSRCELCGCLVDVIHARRHTHCPCTTARLVAQPQQTPVVTKHLHKTLSVVTEDEHLLAA